MNGVSLMSDEDEVCTKTKFNSIEVRRRCIQFISFHNDNPEKKICSYNTFGRFSEEKERKKIKGKESGYASG